MRFKKIAVSVMCLLCIVGLGVSVGIHANTKQENESVVEKKSSPKKIIQENEAIQTNQNVSTCEMGHINCDGVHNACEMGHINCDGVHNACEMGHINCDGLHNNIECDVNNANCVGNHAQNECPFNNENGQTKHDGNGHHGKNHQNQTGRRCNW